MTPSRIVRALTHVSQTEPNTLKGAVATEALQYDDPVAFLTDVVRWGCKTGAVRSLIYYSDTIAFALGYYDEIVALREEVEGSLSEPPQLSQSALNDLAWFAFEETAHRLAEELGVDV